MRFQSPNHSEHFVRGPRLFLCIRNQSL
ncbi:MAG: hypothetical protein ACHQRM_08365 [Bacteroidia bacterium]